MSVPDVSPRTEVPTQVIVGTSEPTALQDMADLTAAGHFHLPAWHVAAARHVLSRLKSAAGQHFYFMKRFNRYLYRTYQLIQG